MDIIYGDIPRIYTAIAEWLGCMVYLSLLNKINLNIKKIINCIAMLLLQIIFLEVSGSWPTVFWIPSMFVASIFMCFFFKLEGNLTFRESLYCYAKAFLLAELAASLEWQIHSYLLFHGNNAIGTEIFNLVFIYVLVFGVMYWAERKIFTIEYIKNLSIQEVLAALGYSIMVFAFSNLSFVSVNSLFTTQIISDIFIIRTLFDIIGVAILYAYQSRICEFAMKTEMDAMQNVLNSQYEMYRNYMNNVELIQMKCHDLKHQIAGLRAETDAEKKKEWLDLLEKEADFQKYNIRTGNNVLDAVLDAKNLIAKKSNIKITCVVNGQLLNTLHVTDICNIFGNALDNAIENTILIPDEEKRLIHITVSEKNNFIIIKIANYCENEVSIQPGSMPETTKLDKRNHGYGLKSIKHSVEKYGGSISIAMNHDWFELKLLIPQIIEN